MSSEEMMIQRIMENELNRMEVLQDSQYTDEDVIVRNWIKKRIKDLTEHSK